MPIEYVNRLPKSDEWTRLFETTGWNAMYGADPEELRAGLGRSWYVISAREAGDLVGLGRLLSDGVLYAVVFDMVVRPDRRGEGIGSEILRRLLGRCEEAGIRDVLLFAAAGTAEFYGRFGFVPRPPEGPGMILRRVGSE